MEVTVKSDIYSLGLILYEIITGKRAFDATTLPELMRMREESRVPNPSTIVRDIDPLFERVILRCLATRSGVASCVGAASFRGVAGWRSAGRGARCRRNAVAANGRGCGRKRRDRAARGDYIFGGDSPRNFAAALFRHQRKRVGARSSAQVAGSAFESRRGTRRENRLSGNPVDRSGASDTTAISSTGRRTNDKPHPDWSQAAVSATRVAQLLVSAEPKRI